jgi:hypothetical protein
VVELVRVTGANQVGVKVRLEDGSFFVAPATIAINPAGDFVSAATGGAPSFVVNNDGQVEIAQPDAYQSKDFDLSRTDAPMEMPIRSGQGVVAVDITGLTGSGATVVVERTVGGIWSGRNLLVTGTAGAFTQSLTADASMTINTVGSRAIRFRVVTAGTGTAKIYANATVNSSLIQMATTLPPGNNRIGSVGIDNFPSSFNVGNFPATQSVSGTVTANINGTVPVSGNVGVSNFPASFQVSNFPATQAITGTVNVGNFPAVQAVSQSGSWAINQAGTWITQAVQSGAWAVTANLGTLNGAATSAKQDSIITALGGRLSVDDYRVPNPAAAGGLSPKVTTNATSFIASAVPCNFFGGVVIARSDGAGAYVFVLNRTTVPASGSTIVMSEVLAMTGYAAGGGASLVPDQVPDRFSAGCVIIVSTSVDTYTPPVGTSIPKYIKARVL